VAQEVIMNKILTYTLALLILSFSPCFSPYSQAEPSSDVVDKIFHPYVLPFEREFEWRLMSRKDDDGNELVQRFAYGHALSEYTVAEFYVLGSRDEDENFELEGYQAEVRWMMTEQGKYWADFGSIVEFEKYHNEKKWAVTYGLLMEKEFGQTSLTLNTLLVYEWGDIKDQELKTEFRAKYRYRWIPQLQPAIELYTGDDFIGIGPAFMGIQRFDSRRQLKWEMGFIAGFNGNSKDHTLRFSLDYEF
jgi:hypothetical protein